MTNERPDSPLDASGPSDRHTSRTDPLGALYGALAKAQAMFTNPVKNQTGHYGKYADLAAVWDAIRGPLASNDLAVIQRVSQRDNEFYLTTVLAHASGAALTDTILLGGTKLSAQDLGKQLTYMRRYVLGALVGVAAEEDADDAPPDGAPVRPDDRKTRKKGEQQQAIDNRPPRVLKPWDGKPDFAINYDSDHHVYVKLVEGRVLQADVRNMRSEDLTLLEEAIPQRQAWFNQNGYARMAEQASRDQRLVAAELLRRAGDLEDDSADGATAEAERPGDDTGGDVPAGAGPDSAKATPDKPAPSSSDRPRVVRYAIHLGMVAEADVVRTSQALGEAELKLLSWLEPAEVAAMIVHPLNAPLFNPAEASDVGRHNRAGAAPLTGEWLATAWLPAHEAAKGDRRRDARKLLRLAIANLDLRLRDEKQAAPEMRADEVTDDEWKTLKAYTAALTAGAKG